LGGTSETFNLSWMFFSGTPPPVKKKVLTAAKNSNETVVGL
jgi:hypothetical protein